ncbi:hypothetical protein CAL7716_104750 (plasmid) [Calothrix sp. PCC 7716]|nr:hypothetical protein CAL7716_104750 [Calothrix sp. PCC 7716]
MNLKYFSQYYKIAITGEEDWFDPCMSLDTLLFIDPFLVFKSNNPFFSKSRENFFDFFRVAFELAHEAIGCSCKAAYKQKQLEEILKFPEVQELCLGFSKESIKGSGSGSGYSKGFTSALIKLAEEDKDKSYKIQHFEEIEIFTLGIGRDRISDATANIIKLELIKYTQSVCQQFKIPTSGCLIKNARFNYKDKLWENCYFTLPKNPFYDVKEREKRRAVILVPKELLGVSHAIGSEGFEDYIKNYRNEDLRANLNHEILKELKKPKSKKEVIKGIAEKHRYLVHDYIKYIEEHEAEIKPYNLEIDNKNLYRNDKKSYEFVIANPIDISVSNEQDFIQFLEFVINQFKIFVEDKEGYKLLWDISKDLTDSSYEYKHRNEFNAQSLFAEIMLGYCKFNDITISNESEICKKIINFIFSEYNNSAFIKLKLAKNILSKQYGLENFLVDVRMHDTHHNYLVAIAYAEKEIEGLEKLLKEIELMRFDDIRFKFVIVNANNIYIPDISKNMNPQQGMQDNSILDFLQKIYDKLATLDKINDKVIELDYKVSSLDSISKITMQDTNGTSNILMNRYEETIRENESLKQNIEILNQQVEDRDRIIDRQEEYIKDLVAQIDQASKYISSKEDNNGNFTPEQVTKIVELFKDIPGRTTNFINQVNNDLRNSSHALSNFGTNHGKQTGNEHNSPPPSKTNIKDKDS